MILEILNILFLIWAVKWMQSLVACECSRGLKRDFMQMYFSAALVYQFAALLGLSSLLKWPMGGLAVAYGFVAFSFIKDMESKLCSCSGKARARWFFWVTLAQTAWAIAHMSYSR
jgi:hypothetical protein